MIKRILIVAATPRELDFLGLICRNKKIISENLLSYTYKNLKLDVLITGVGMIHTVYFLSQHLFSNRYDLVVNIGLAGSFKKNIPLCSVVNVISDCFAEMGAEDGEKLIPLEKLKLFSLKSSPLKNGSLENNFKLKSSSLTKLKKVKGITVNTVHGNKQSIKKIIDRLNPYVETMEGAAFAYVCSLQKTNYLQLRAISNLVERRNKSGWKIKEALSGLEIFMISFLGDLNRKN